MTDEDDLRLRLSDMQLNRLFRRLHNLREAAMAHGDVGTLRKLHARAELLEDATLNDLHAVEGG